MYFIFLLIFRGIVEVIISDELPSTMLGDSFGDGTRWNGNYRRDFMFQLCKFLRRSRFKYISLPYFPYLEFDYSVTF